MTQQQPYANGTKVLYGVFYMTGPMSEDLDHEATIVGFTHLDDNLYYVLEADRSEEGCENMLFIRPHDKVRVDTTLPQYICDYIEDEVERNGTEFRIKLPGHMGSLRHWIEEAIDAYEGGAR